MIAAFTRGVRYRLHFYAFLNSSCLQTRRNILEIDRAGIVEALVVAETVRGLSEEYALGSEASDLQLGRTIVENMMTGGAI